MIELDFSRCRTKPDPPQLEGIKALVRNPYFAIFDTMGWIGKTKQVIDAACFLYEAGEIDTVLVCCPAQVKINWTDREFGQIQEHSWIKGIVHDFTASRRVIPQSKDSLVWSCVSYEWARRSRELISAQLLGRKVMMVADESIKIAAHDADTTKVILRIRDDRACRAVALNGTPGDMVKAYAQYRFLSKTFWPYQNFFHYRAHFCVMGGPRIAGQYRKVVSFKHKDEFDALTVPYTLRRHKPEGAPEKYWQLLSCTLSPTTWKHYISMRQEMITWLEHQPSNLASVANQAVTKGLRLAQITSGFLGGVEDIENNTIGCHEIGSEKTDEMVSWVNGRVKDNPDLRLILWCRFRPEIERMVRLLREAGHRVVCIIGQQSKTERREAIKEFTTGHGGCILVGQQQAGGFGLNLVTADEEVFVSNDCNLVTREQAEDRPYRRGRTKDLTVWDMLAYGPAGQKTIDHILLKTLKDKKELFRWTAENWRTALLAE